LTTVLAFPWNDVDVWTSHDVDARYAVVFLLSPLLIITYNTAVQQTTPEPPPSTGEHGKKGEKRPYRGVKKALKGPYW